MLNNEKIDKLKKEVDSIRDTIGVLQGVIYSKQYEIRIMRQKCFENELEKFLKSNAKLFKLKDYHGVYEALNEYAKSIMNSIFGGVPNYDTIRVNKNKETGEWDLELFW